MTNLCTKCGGSGRLPYAYFLSKQCNHCNGFMLEPYVRPERNTVVDIHGEYYDWQVTNPCSGVMIDYTRCRG